MIIRLLKLEFLKAKKYSFFFIFSIFIIFFFIIIVVNLSNPASQISSILSNQQSERVIYFQFPFIWKTLVWIAGWFSHLWAFLILLLIGKEYYSNVSEQKNVLKEKNDKTFFSKIIFILTIPLIMVILILFFGIFLGEKNTEIKLFQIFNNSFYLITYYLQVIVYMSFAFLIVVLLESTALSFVVYIGYLIFEAIGRFILNQAEIGGIIYFLPMKSLSLLTPKPVIEVESDKIIGDLTSSFPIIISLLISFVYLILINIVTFLVLRKKRNKK